MVNKSPICPERIRVVPRQFSWVDQRLVRERHLKRLSHEAAALYLFLVTVADRQGLSYYADHNIALMLGMDETGLKRARHGLLQAELIAHREPLYQVLELPAVHPRSAARSASSPDQAMSMAQILKRITEGGHDRS